MAKKRKKDILVEKREDISVEEKKSVFDLLSGMELYFKRGMGVRRYFFVFSSNKTLRELKAEV